MRVEAVAEMPKRAGGAGAVAVDPGADLAIRNFLAVIDSDDSLFCVAQPLVGPCAEALVSGHVSSGDMVLEFRQDELRGQKGLHFLLVEKLIELLKEAGSPETLEATLSLPSGITTEKQERGSRKQFGLWVRLAARGNSPEQAVLRWGLGLAHLQQALLFTSRHLRLHLAQTGN
jgi:hypothetical protein